MFSLLLLSIFYSCQESDNAIYTPLPEAKVLTDCELIFRFDTEYPLQVQEKDSLLFLTSRKSDKCITVINKNTKSVSQKFANRGMGPNDAIDPEFIVNNYLYNDSLLLTDANSGRFLYKNQHKAQRKAKFYINKCRSASCMQGGLKQASA